MKARICTSHTTLKSKITQYRIEWLVLQGHCVSWEKNEHFTHFHFKSKELGDYMEYFN